MHGGLRTKVAQFFCALVWTTHMGLAWAHDSGASYSTLVLFEGEASYRMEISSEALPKTPDGVPQETKPTELLEPFLETITLKTNRGNCQRNLTDTAGDDDALILRISFLCPKGASQFSFTAGFVEVLPSWHRHIFKAEDPSGAVTEQTILKNSETTVHFDATPAGALSVVRAFVILGIEHILIGYDHILFLVGLLVVARNFKKILGLVTAFTLAHSVTLVLATVLREPASATIAVEIALGIGLAATSFEYLPVLRHRPLPRAAAAIALGLLAISVFFVVGHLKDPIKLVEVTIAASVVFVGIENFFLDPSKRRWVLAFSFGLIHGFGFASVLSELHLPTTHLVSSLVSFNVGVEMGQIAIVLLTYPLITRLAQTESRGRKITFLLNSVIVAGGLFFLASQFAF